MDSEPAGTRDTFREQVGKALGDAFELERELEGGGLSRVFVARDRRLGRRIAVKVLDPTPRPSELAWPRECRQPPRASVAVADVERDQISNRRRGSPVGAVDRLEVVAR